MKKERERESERERERETENMQIMSGSRFELTSQNLEHAHVVADTEANQTSPYGSWDQPAGGFRKLGLTMC